MAHSITYTPIPNFLNAWRLTAVTGETKLFETLNQLKSQNDFSRRLTHDDYGCICVANFNLQCNMQNGNAIFKIAMYVISVFKFTFFITPHVQSLVQKENEIILFTFAISNSSLNM